MFSLASVAVEFVAASAQPRNGSEDRDRTIRYAANLVTAAFATLCVIAVSAISVLLGLT